MSTHPRLPDQTHLLPDDAGIAPRDKTIVVALGNSVMWGQGNARNDIFAWQFTLDAVRPGTDPSLVNRAHSGAQVRVRDEGQLDDFADTFPTLFSGKTDRERFLAAGVEGVADLLDGEVPAANTLIRIMSWPSTS